MKLLLIKTSSIGDLLHCFPALTDAQRAVPGLSVTWVVEEGLAEIPTWHPSVQRIITVGYRRWRFRPIKGLFGGPLARLRREIAEESYDLVLDAQGLYKSAVLARMARGPRHGYDLASSREKLAPLAYQVRHRIPRSEHAVIRLRRLFAEALGYALPQTPPTYGLARDKLPAPPLSGRYLVFLHGTAWSTKLWPESHWQGLAELAAAAGYWVVLPYGSRQDQGRAERIAVATGKARTLPTGSLATAAGLIAGAAGCVAVDTGLGHLAAALGVPTLSLYGPTGPARTGTLGQRTAQLASDLPCAPCRKKLCAVTGRPRLPAPCLAGLTEGRVWLRLADLMTRQAAGGAGA
jgi:heptosyltransferase-1